MLIDSLYQLQSFQNEAQQIKATLSIDAAHPVFAGHFPGQPVLPGVCQVQLIKELLEKALDKTLFFSAATQCKFLQMVDPRITHDLEIEICYREPETNHWDLTAVIRNGETVFLKMNSSYQLRQQEN